MSLAKRFEELRIWNEAREQVRFIYLEFSELRDFGFRDQIQRAAVSVMNNIAEGFERKTPRDFAHFLDLSKGSCGEVRSMLYVAEDLDYIDSTTAADLRGKSEKLAGGIAAFTSHLRK